MIGRYKPVWKSAPYDITGGWSHPRRVTDKLATFATVYWVGWWTDLSQHTSRWTRPLPATYDVIRGRFPKRLVTANHTTPGGMVMGPLSIISGRETTDSGNRDITIRFIFVMLTQISLCLFCR